MPPGRLEKCEAASGARGVWLAKGRRAASVLVVDDTALNLEHPSIELYHGNRCKAVLTSHRRQRLQTRRHHTPQAGRS